MAGPAVDFEQFALSRDMVYLGVVFAALAACSFLSIWRRGYIPLKNVNRLVSRGVFMLSGMIVCLTAALVLSHGRILTSRPLLIPALAAFVLLTAAARSPRAVGFPLILAAGLAVIIFGYAFLRLPLLDTHSESRIASIRFEGSNRFTLLADSSSAQQSFSTGAGELDLECRLVRFNPVYPFIGGQIRGELSASRPEIPLPVSRFGIRVPAWGGRLGITFSSPRAALNLREPLPGAVASLFYDGKTLYFRVKAP